MKINLPPVPQRGTPEFTRYAVRVMAASETVYEAERVLNGHKGMYLCNNPPWDWRTNDYYLVSDVDALNRPYTRNFESGKTYRTRGGKLVKVINEVRDSRHHYDHVLCDDNICRYDRFNDTGRVTGQSDPNCADDLLPEEVKDGQAI